MSGTLTGPQSGTLTAQAADGYVLSNPEWSYTVNLPAAQDCTEPPRSPQTSTPRPVAGSPTG